MKCICFKVMALFSLALFVASNGLNAQLKKNKLRVLYVGGSSNFTDDSYATKEEKNEDIKSRMASFENMLKKYFRQVSVIHVKDYTTELSSKYDVTVMDAAPGSKMYNPDFDRNLPGNDDQSIRYEEVNFLPHNFNDAMLFIGETGHNLGRKIGLRFVAACICLKSDAYNINLNHEIFKRPFAVKINTRQQPLPEGAASKNYREDKIFPSVVPMWQVQTLILSEAIPRIRPGIICDPAAFDRSPDVENISGGVSKVSANGVAIARHGNYFLWGFAASPEYLTKEAEVVLANAIAYISKYKGHKAISRRFDGNALTAYDIIERKSKATLKTYELIKVAEKNYREKQDSILKLVQNKKKMQGLLTSEEEMLLEKKTPSDTLTLERWLKLTQGRRFDSLGTDLKAYKKYFEENMGYFVDKGNQPLIVDEDLKSLRLNKSDIKVLDTAIKLWETGKDVEKAKRLLDRYTLASFTEPQEWRRWYEENKSRLFFTESGGYYFLINTNNEVEGNDYLRKQTQAQYSKIAPGETTERNPVSVAVSAVPLENRNKHVVVKFKIHPGYHIYNQVSPEDPYFATEIAIVPPPGYKKVGKLKYLAPIVYSENGTSVFKDEAIFVQEFAPEKDDVEQGDALCTVAYQSCNEDKCLPPVSNQYKIRL